MHAQVFQNEIGHYHYHLDVSLIEMADLGVDLNMLEYSLEVSHMLDVDPLV